MIIKEKSIKSYIALENVLRYILSKQTPENSFVFKRYIKGDRLFEEQLQYVQHDIEATSIITEQRLQEMKRQYMINDKQRLHKRKGETKFYHAILSFHKDDELSQEQLLKVAKKYTKERFPNSIVVATNHTDTKHQHLHLIGSNVEYGIHTTRYLTKSQFREIKQEMERWQNKELELVYSRVDHSKKKSNHFLKMRNTKSTYVATKVKNST